MDVNESMKSLLNEDVLVRRSSARNLSDLAESDPTKFKEDDLGGIVKVLHEDDDPLTLDYLLRVIDFVSPLNLPYLVNSGLLRILVEVYMRNMGGIGINVGRNAIRLISTLASVDTEGAEKLDVVGLILRAITESPDPYIRWYGSSGLRKLDPSLIRKGAFEITKRGLDALAKENEDRIRIMGALTLSLVASISPEVLAEKDGIKTLVKTLLRDPSPDVQGLVTLALQFAGRRNATILHGNKVGEALCLTLINKLEGLKKNDNRADREVLVMVASTISILAMRDLPTLTESKGIEEINITEVVTKALAESEVGDQVLPFLLSILLELSYKAEEYINNKKTIKVLVDLLEGGEAGDAVNRSVLSILNQAAYFYPTLFSDPGVLEKLAAAALKREKSETEKVEGRGPSPSDVLETLLDSEKGHRLVATGFQRLYKQTPYLVTELCEARNWTDLISEVKGEPVPALKIEKRERVEAAKGREEEKMKPAPSRKLDDAQRAMLQQILDTYAQITLAELATKLNIQENIIKEVLVKLIQSGKLPYRIENEVLYLKEKPVAPLQAAAKRKSLPCIWCGVELDPSKEKCPNCGKAPPKCLICNVKLTAEDQLEKCPFCGTLFHREHYRKWTEEKKKCPKCRVSWAAI